MLPDARAPVVVSMTLATQVTGAPTTVGFGVQETVVAVGAGAQTTVTTFEVTMTDPLVRLL